MKFTVSSKELTEKMKPFGQVVSQNKTIPVLDCLLFTLGENLKIRVSDLEIDMEVSMDVVSKEGSGSFAVDARSLIGLLHEIKDEAILISVEEELTVKTATGEYSMPIVDAEDYPLKPVIPNDSFLMVKQSVLLKGISSSIPSIASEEIQRPVLCGVCIDSNDGLFITATNMMMMSWYETSDFTGSKVRFVIPKRMALVLKSALKNVQDTISIYVGEKNALFAFDNMTISCRLIDGNYPNSKSVFPVGEQKNMLIDRAMFISALKRVNAVASKTSKVVTITSGENMLIQAQDIDFRLSGKENVKTNTEDTDLVSIGLNKDALISTLSTLEGYDVDMYYSAPNRIVTFQSNDVKILLMPLLIK